MVNTAKALNASSNVGVVLVTAGSEDEAVRLAEVLVQEKLAACVNLMPVESIYIWEGSLQRDREWQLLIKTNLTRFDALAQRVQDLHSYELPETIALKIIDGSPPYLAWVADQTAP